MDDVRLLQLPDEDVNWLSLWNVASCCMAGDFL